MSGMNPASNINDHGNDNSSSNNSNSNYGGASGNNNDSNNNNNGNLNYAFPIKLHNLQTKKQQEIPVSNPSPFPAKLHNLQTKKQEIPVSNPSPIAEKETRMEHLRSLGLLSVTDTFPLEFGCSFQPRPQDVVVHGNTAGSSSQPNQPITTHSNPECFQNLLYKSVPAFQGAISLREPKTVKKIVEDIIHFVIRSNGYYVIQDDVDEQGLSTNDWKEVSRNLAERYTLQELRKACTSYRQCSAKAAEMGTRYVTFECLDEAMEAAGVVRDGGAGGRRTAFQQPSSKKRQRL